MASAPLDVFIVRLEHELAAVRRRLAEARDENTLLDGQLREQRKQTASLCAVLTDMTALSAQTLLRVHLCVLTHAREVEEQAGLDYDPRALRQQLFGGGLQNRLTSAPGASLSAAQLVREVSSAVESFNKGTDAMRARLADCSVDVTMHSLDDAPGAAGVSGDPRAAERVYSGSSSPISHTHTREDAHDADAMRMSALRMSQNGAAWHGAAPVGGGSLAELETRVLELTQSLVSCERRHTAEKAAIAKEHERTLSQLAQTLRGDITGLTAEVSNLQAALISAEQERARVAGEKAELERALQSFLDVAEASVTAHHSTHGVDAAVASPLRAPEMSHAQAAMQWAVRDVTTIGAPSHLRVPPSTSVERIMATSQPPAVRAIFSQMESLDDTMRSLRSRIARDPDDGADGNSLALSSGDSMSTRQLVRPRAQSFADLQIVPSLLQQASWLRSTRQPASASKLMRGPLADYAASLAAAEEHIGNISRLADSSVDRNTAPAVGESRRSAEPDRQDVRDVGSVPVSRASTPTNATFDSAGSPTMHAKSRSTLHSASKLMKRVESAPVGLSMSHAGESGRASPASVASSAAPATAATSVRLQAERLRRAAKASDDQVAAAVQQHRALQDALTREQRQVEALTASLATADTTIATLRVRLAAAEQHATEADARIAELEEDARAGGTRESMSAVELQQATASRDAALAEVTRVHSATADLRLELGITTERLKHVSAECTELRDRCSRLERERDASIERGTRLEATLRELSGARGDGSSSDRVDGQTSGDALLAQNSLLREQLAVQEQQHVSARTHNAELASQFAEAQAEAQRMQGELELLREQLQQAAAERAKLEAAVTDAQDAVKRLAEQQALDEVARARQAEAEATLRQDVETMATDSRRAHEELVDTKLQVSAMSAAVQAARSEAEGVARDRDRLQAELYAANARIDSLRAAIQVVDTSTRRFQEGASSTAEDVLKLQAALSDVSGQLAAVTVELEATRARADDAQRALDTANSKLLDHASDVLAAREALQAARGEADDFLRQRNTLHEAQANLQRELAERSAQCVELESRQQELELECTRLQETLAASAADVQALTREKDTVSLRAEEALAELQRCRDALQATLGELQAARDNVAKSAVVSAPTPAPPVILEVTGEEVAPSSARSQSQDVSSRRPLQVSASIVSPRSAREESPGDSVLSSNLPDDVHLLREALAKEGERSAELQAVANDAHDRAERAEQLSAHLSARCLQLESDLAAALYATTEAAESEAAAAAATEVASADAAAALARARDTERALRDAERALQESTASVHRLQKQLADTQRRWDLIDVESARSGHVNLRKWRDAVDLLIAAERQVAELQVENNRLRGHLQTLQDRRDETELDAGLHALISPVYAPSEPTPSERAGASSTVRTEPQLRSGNADQLALDVAQALTAALGSAVTAEDVRSGSWRVLLTAGLQRQRVGPEEGAGSLTDAASATALGHEMQHAAAQLKLVSLQKAALAQELTQVYAALRALEASVHPRSASTATPVAPGRQRSHVDAAEASFIRAVVAPPRVPARSGSPQSTLRSPAPRTPSSSTLPSPFTVDPVDHISAPPPDLSSARRLHALGAGRIQASRPPILSAQSFSSPARVWVSTPGSMPRRR